MSFAFHPSFYFVHLAPGALSPPARFGRDAYAAAAVAVLIATLALLSRSDAQTAVVPHVAAATPSLVTTVEPLTPFAVTAAGAVHNRLVVTVTRTAVEPAGVSLRVDGGTPYPLPSLAAHHATIALNDLVVQRRAPVRIEVLGADSRILHSRTIVVAPDEPNDLGVDSIRADGSGLLTARIVNHSPIPLHGDLVLAARMHPDGALLARAEVYLDVAAGDWQDIAVGNVGAVDVARIQVGLATDAVEDTDISNNTYRP